MKTAIATLNADRIHKILHEGASFDFRKNGPVDYQDGFRVLLCESNGTGRIVGEYTCDRVRFINPTDLYLRVEAWEKATGYSLRDLLAYANDRPIEMWRVTKPIAYCNVKGYGVRYVYDYGLKRAPASWAYAKKGV